MQSSAWTSRRPVFSTAFVFIIPDKKLVQDHDIFGMDLHPQNVSSQCATHDETTVFDRHLSICNTTLDGAFQQEFSMLNTHPLTLDRRFSNRTHATASQGLLS
jgi:hypothetical protein